MDPKNYESLRNRTLLFFIEKLVEIELIHESQIISRENPNTSSSCKKARTLHDLSCQFGSKGFTKEMRQIAGGSQSGLKKFLAEYPSIFNIEGDLVSYKETSSLYSSNSDDDEDGGDNPSLNNDNQGSSPKPAKRSVEDSAIEYFRERMIQYGIGVWVPVKSLLGHRSQAPTEIRHVSGQHIDEFTAFLLRHPKTFQIRNDAVILTEFLENSNTNNSNSNNLVIDNPDVLSTTTLSSHAHQVDKEKILDLLQFFGSILKTRGPMLVEQLFHASQFREEEEDTSGSCFFKTPNDLKSFFQMHTECFQVHSNLVTLSDFYESGVEYFKKNLLKGVGGQGEGKGVEIVAINSRVKPELVRPPPPVVKDVGKGISTGQGQGSGQGQGPTLANRVSQILLKTITQNTSDQHHQRRSFSAPSTPSMTFDTAKDPEELRQYLQSVTKVVSNPKMGKKIVDDLLRRKCVLSVDLEGVNLGDEGIGRITLVQICCKSEEASGEGAEGVVVFIFDVLTQSGLMEELRPLLSGEDNLKVLHDCRNDSSALHKEHGIYLSNVFDTQCAHVVLNQQEKNVANKNVSLNHLCSAYGVRENPFKDKVKSAYRHDQRFWSRRPLTSQMIAYASCDVVCLHHLYRKLSPLPEQSSELLQELIEEQIMAFISPDEIRQRRKIRKNEKDLQELKSKIEDSLSLDQPLVLSNREMRLLRHLTLSDPVKEKLKLSSKIAKKLEKLEKKDLGGEPEVGSTSSASCSSSEPMSLEMNNNHNNNNSYINHHDEENFTKNIVTIESLLEGLSNVIEKKFKEAGAQTHSTGDIVVMKVYEE